MKYTVEDKYMKAWQVVDDIDLLYRNISDTDFGDNKDNILNALLGMYTIYQLRFEELQETHEQSLVKNVNPEPDDKDIKISKLQDDVLKLTNANNTLRVSLLRIDADVKIYKSHIEELSAEPQERHAMRDKHEKLYGEFKALLAKYKTISDTKSELQLENDKLHADSELYKSHIKNLEKSLNNYKSNEK